MRQLAAYEARKAEFDALEATIYAASVDSLEQAKEVAERGFSFPIAYGVTIEEGEGFGAWKAEDNHGIYLQPTEFLLGRGGVVLGSMYASGPVLIIQSLDGVAGICRAPPRRLVTNRSGRGSLQSLRPPGVIVFAPEAL